MSFASDNWAGACPEVIAALGALDPAFAPAYGEDTLTTAMNEALGRLFEKHVASFIVATGSAANALALSAFAKPAGLVLAQRNAHIIVDEYGGPERMNPGQRLIGLAGQNSKITLQDLQTIEHTFSQNTSHHGHLTGLSLTQATELGQVYTVDELKTLCHAAKAMGLGLHMDGARFANAVAHLGCTPAEITWKAGIDLLSFGLTKNGAWCADLLICFDNQLAENLEIQRKQMGHGFSKPRFIAGQVLAMIEDNIWLKNAGHANKMALKLAEALTGSGKADIPLPPQANGVFGYFDLKDVSRLHRDGIMFYPWSDEDIPLAQKQSEKKFMRLVTSFRTQESDIERFLSHLS